VGVGWKTLHYTVTVHAPPYAQGVMWFDQADPAESGIRFSIGCRLPVAG